MPTVREVNTRRTAIHGLADDFDTGAVALSDGKTLREFLSLRRTKSSRLSRNEFPGVDLNCRIPVPTIA